MQETTTTDKVVITSFTDPICTWCWGTEPVLRALETHFPNQIELRFVMGGLVEDARTFHDLHNDIGGKGSEDLNHQVAVHWLEASQKHGMPVNIDGYHLFSDEYPSTYPQSIAYKAAQMSDPDLADLFLYNMRVAVASQCKVISREDVQVSIASESGLDLASFLGHLHDGSAKAAFEEDLRRTTSLGVRGFPSFTVEYGDTRYLLRGYTSFNAFAAVIESATQGKVKPSPVTTTPEALLAFMEAHPRMAAEEVRQAFDLATVDDVREFVAPLVESGELEVHCAGNGWFVNMASQGMVCDPATGVCA